MVKTYKVESDFEVDGYRCVVLGLARGYRCGYVAIDKEHPVYGKYYLDIDVDVHGGLSYGEICNKYPVKTGQEYYWLGFDCIHMHDGRDMELLKSFEKNGETNHYIELYNSGDIPFSHGVVRSNEYVKEELIRLVEQLKGLESEEVKHEESI